MTDANLNLVAFCGLVQLDHWELTSNQGARIKLSLWNGRDDLEHFDKVTKRTKRRAGQRYFATWQDPVSGETIEGMPSEVWFGGASWSHRSGATVLFTLMPEDIEAIKGQRTKDETGEGTRWYLALVELDDDDQPIDQAQRDMLESLTPAQPKGGPVSKNAGMLCDTEDFQRFLQAHFQTQVNDGKEAAVLLRQHCGVDSRAWLDHDDEARAKYEELKQAFMRWGRRYGRTG